MLNIRKEASSLHLMKDGIVIGTREWVESRDMGGRLFQSIDDILIEQSLRPEQVSGFEIDSVISENSTSMRIAETVKKVYTFGVTSKTDKKG